MSATPSRSRRTPNFLAWGVAMVAIAVALVAFAFLKRVPGVPRTEVRAVVVSTGSLAKNAPVRVAGVDVGKVVGLEPGPGRLRTVTMALDGDAPVVRSDGQVRIRPRLFLEGGFYVELEPGSPSARPLGDGGRLALSPGAVPVQLDQLLTTFDAATRRALRRLLTDGSRALTGGGAAGMRRFLLTLEPTVHGVAVAAQAVAGTRPHDVSALVAGAAKATQALDRNRAALDGTISGLHRTLRVTATRSAQLGAGVRGLDGVLRDAPPTLRAVDAALPGVRRVVAELRPALPAAPAALRATAGLVRQVGGAMAPSELPAVTAALTPVVRALPPLEQRLGVLLPQVRTVAACLDDRVLPVATSVLKDGALSTGDPVWQDLAHAVVGMAGASQNFDANGHYVRLLAAIGAGALATGTLPEAGQVFSDALGGQIGSRPRPLPPGTVPPFRPGADCAAQPRPDLTGHTASPDFTPVAGGARAAAVTPSLLTRLLTAARRTARGRTP